MPSRFKPRHWAIFWAWMKKETDRSKNTKIDFIFFIVQSFAKIRGIIIIILSRNLVCRLIEIKLYYRFGKHSFFNKKNKRGKKVPPHNSPVFRQLVHYYFLVESYPFRHKFKYINSTFHFFSVKFNLMIAGFFL